MHLAHLWIGEVCGSRPQERRERHRQNYMHITIHTSQTWADTFISELNDTHVEAELRTKHIPPQVPAHRPAPCCPHSCAVCRVLMLIQCAVSAPPALLPWCQAASLACTEMRPWTCLGLRQVSCAA